MVFTDSKTYTDMYPIQDKDGAWIVVRVSEGSMDITPYTMKTKETAINYCQAHGFMKGDKQCTI